jgi:hypothetical protein
LLFLTCTGLAMKWRWQAQVMAQDCATREPPAYRDVAVVVPVRGDHAPFLERALKSIAQSRYVVAGQSTAACLSRTAGHSAVHHRYHIYHQKIQNDS